VTLPLQWINVAPEDAVPLNGHASFEADGRFIAVYDVQGVYYAIEDVCTHDGAPLADAPVEAAGAADVASGATGPVVICPRHGARFCLKSGASLSPPAYEPVTCFATRIDAGRLWIQVGP
jgi:3-phenylpropionate/trans-cinnamate dioxygenase ferredoxin subunit